MRLGNICASAVLGACGLGLAMTGCSSKSGSARSAGDADGTGPFASATEITLSRDPVPGTLVDLETPSLYKFSIWSPGAVGVWVNAQRLAAGVGSRTYDNPAVVDTVVSLYDSTEQLIASDDDEWPRDCSDSQLFTELAAGDYYIAVDSCQSFAAAHPDAGMQCGSAADVFTLDYELTVSALGPTDGSAAGTTVQHSTFPGTTYAMALLGGTFTAQDQVQSYPLTFPDPLRESAYSPGRAYFWIQSIGPLRGNGSTSNVKAWATSDAAGNDILGAVDQTHASDGLVQFTFPLKLLAGGSIDTSATYYLWTRNTGSADDGFYFIVGHLGSYYLGELESPTPHGDLATAQPLTSPPVFRGGYFPAGHLDTPTEQDWYQMAVPGWATGFYIYCGVEREGSGLLGFSATLVDGSGTDSSATLGEMNPASTDLWLDGSAHLPTGLVAGAPAYLRIDATGQSSVNPANYYRCDVVFL